MHHATPYFLFSKKKTTELTGNIELVINATPGGVDIALLREKVLIELHREQRNQEYAVGDVYLGRVKKILPHLNACFVDVGYSKDAFLHYLDLGPQFGSLNLFHKKNHWWRTKKFRSNEFPVCA
jgi:hypothetical protein